MDLEAAFCSAGGFEITYRAPVVPFALMNNRSGGSWTSDAFKSSSLGGKNGVVEQSTDVYEVEMDCPGPRDDGRLVDAE